MIYSIPSFCGIFFFANLNKLFFNYSLLWIFFYISFKGCRFAVRQLRPGEMEPGPEPVLLAHLQGQDRGAK